MNRLIAVVVLLALAPFVQAGTPNLDARQARQNARIEQGVASGALTAREAARLDAQQHRIARREARAKSDGMVTRRERAQLQRSAHRASRNIRHQKHDRQHRH